MFLRCFGGVSVMSKMDGLALCGGVEARCVLSRLDSALKPLIPFKKFKESTVELRNLRFLEGAIPARSKALVWSPKEDCWQPRVECS